MFDRKTPSMFRLALIVSLLCLPMILLGSKPSLATVMDGSSLTTAPISPDELKADPKTSLAAIAEARFQRGEWDEAARYSTGLLSLDPKSVKAHGILGAVFALRGQTEMAQKELEALQKLGDQGFYPDLITAILRAQSGKRGEAESYLDSALKKEPGHPVATYYAGSLSLAGGTLDRAEKLFRAALAPQPNFPAALAGMGQVCLRQGRKDEAIRYYEEAVQNEPENLLYRGQLLEIYKGTGRKDAADRQVREIAYYTPGIKEGYLVRGMQLVLEGSYREAIELMDKILGIYKNVPDAYFIKAAALANLKDTKQALESIQAYVSARGAFAQTHHYAGMCYLALDRIDDAEEEFKRAVLLDPQMGISFVPLVIIEQLRGRYDVALGGLKVARAGGEPAELVSYLEAHILLAKGDEAGYQMKMRQAAALMPGLKQDVTFLVPKQKDRERFARERNLMALYFYNSWSGMTLQASRILLELDKGDAFAWYYRALSEIQQRRRENAVESFNQLLRIHPDLLAAQMGLSQLYVQAGEYDKALASLKRAVEAYPESSPAYVALGDVYLRRGQEQQSIQAYRKAIDLNPKSFEAHLNLASLLSEHSENLNEALRLASRAEDLKPKDPYALDVLGWVYLQKGETAKALRMLKEAASSVPQNPIIQYHLGIAYYKNDDYQEARKALDAAVRLSDNFKGIEQAREILKKVSK